MVQRGMVFLERVDEGIVGQVVLKQQGESGRRGKKGHRRAKREVNGPKVILSPVNSPQAGGGDRRGPAVAGGG